MATATNKRPAPAKSPAQLKAVPKPAKPDDLDNDDLDDDDDDDDVDGNADAGEAPTLFRRLPKHIQISVRLNNGADRLIKYTSKIDNWLADEAGLVAETQSVLRTALASLKTAAELLVKLPDDYKSRARKAGKGKGVHKGEMAVGTVVRITDKALAEYEGMEDFDPTGLVTMSPSAPRIWCKTKDGAKALIPRGHLTVDAANGVS
jgi:hypothetical protein